jgi:hypothetical protein
MRFKHFCLFFILLAFAAGCATVSVNYDYDPDVNFTNLKTFNWLPNPKSTTRHGLVLNRVKVAVKRELKSKGIVMVSDNPDFLIAIHGDKHSRTTITDWGYSPGRYGRYWGPRNIDVYQYEEGTLILDFVDANIKELIWRGTATGIVDPDLSPEKRTEKINNAVMKILDKFPPTIND